MFYEMNRRLDSSLFFYQSEKKICKKKTPFTGFYKSTGILNKRREMVVIGSKICPVIHFKWWNL
jgi:hypothetical protein